MVYVAFSEGNCSLKLSAFFKGLKFECVCHGKTTNAIINNNK